MAVALSGGVDSTFAASLLLEQGHEVLGLSLSLGQGPDPAPSAGAQAAAQLGIPHQVVDARAQFDQGVVQPAVREYLTGRTPNPCAVCNAKVKLPLLWEAASRAGCAALATGHYARLVAGLRGPVLAEGADPRKSQAYFLARVAPELLKRLLFPLGGMTKDQVRLLARQAGLKAAEGPESQDACFLPPGGWGELVGSRQAPRPGPVVDRQGRLLGRHGGIHRFTVGQRRGLGVASGRPLYVLALDAEQASVQVGPESELWAGGLEGVEPLWYMEPQPEAELRVRLRYTHPGAACRVSRQGRAVSVRFMEPQRAVAPGQLAVFYQGERVIGSACIDKSIPKPLRGTT